MERLLSLRQSTRRPTLIGLRRQSPQSPHSFRCRPVHRFLDGLARTLGCLRHSRRTRAYTLQDYPSEEQATADGARITHSGPCGQCSSLQNLAIYIQHPDLTDPVRECGIKGMLEGDQANIQCLMDIGFDLPCAEIWLQHAAHPGGLFGGMHVLVGGTPPHDGWKPQCLHPMRRGQIRARLQGCRGKNPKELRTAVGLCRPCDSRLPCRPQRVLNDTKIDNLRTYPQNPAVIFTSEEKIGVVRMP